VRFVPPEGTDLVAPLPPGSVFQAARIREGGEVLVCKRLLPRVRAEPAARAAMVREASALARARHPALPELRRVGTDAHGPFVIEGLVEGASVRGIVEGWRARGRPVPATLCEHVAVAAAEALAEVHELSGDDGPLDLSHGDLTPDHVILTPVGAIAFVDLGAARWAGMDAALETGDRGTLPFVAPEVARGEAPPGQAADAYGLGATILFLASGGAPLVEAEDEGAMLLEVGERGIGSARCDGAVGLAAGGRAALREALAFDAARRPASARALASALARALSR
jgi:eukaryotic-like serine/threonine-protein kinase